MRKRISVITTLCLAAALVLLMVAPASSRHRDVHLIAALTGAEEPDPGGDPNGYGAARVTLRHGRVCYHIAAREIGEVVGGHIHRGASREAGPVVVPLFEAADLDPSRRGCVRPESRAIYRAIRRNPGNFYVNVHTDEFPGGAVRGQLTR